MAKSGFSGKNILINLIVTIVAGRPSICTLQHFIAFSCSSR